MELAAGVGEQPREVPDALEVSHSDGAAFEAQRPVVALPAKDVEVGDGWLLRSAVRRDRHRVVGCRLGFDPVEDRAGRFELEAARCSLPLARRASAKPARASAASYGAPTSLQSRAASAQNRSASAGAPSASRTLP